MGSDDQNHTRLFELDHVGVEIDGQQILRDLTCSLPDEHISVLLGPSGSGKTTILRLLNRLEVVTSGEVRFRAQPIESQDPLELRRRVGMVFQRPTVFPGTGRENLQTASPDASDDQLVELLKAADLDGSFLDRVADDLSGGEAQRLCLARALATQPEVLLMDEPTSSLDRDATRYLETTAHALLDRGLSMVWVTHDLEQAQRLAHHHIVICEGRLATHAEMTAYMEQQ